MTSELRHSVSAVTLELAARMVNLPPAELRRYAAMDLVTPSRVEGDCWWYGQAELARLRKVRRLRDELGLNMAGVEVVLRLTEQIEHLHRRLRDDLTLDT